MLEQIAHIPTGHRVDRRLYDLLGEGGRGQSHGGQVRRVYEARVPPQNIETVDRRDPDQGCYAGVHRNESVSRPKASEVTWPRRRCPAWTRRVPNYSAIASTASSYALRARKRRTSDGVIDAANRSGRPTSGALCSPSM